MSTEHERKLEHTKEMLKFVKMGYMQGWQDAIDQTPVPRGDMSGRWNEYERKILQGREREPNATDTIPEKMVRLDFTLSDSERWRMQAREADRAHRVYLQGLLNEGWVYNPVLRTYTHPDKPEIMIIDG